MCPDSDPQRFPSSTLVILVADLAGFARCFRTRSDSEMAHFLDRYYALAESVLTDSQGRVVKFMGDSVLAIFPREHAARAVEAAVTLDTLVRRLGEVEGMDVTLGVNVHMGSVVEAELGHGVSRRPDVIGRAVSQAFLLGRGPGIRLSEPVYRSLPSEERAPWEKNKPPVVYTLGEDAQTYLGLRKSAEENASRW